MDKEDSTQRLIAKTKAYRRAASLAEERRVELARYIVRAAMDGVRQADIVRITGYTRESIRRIVRETLDQELGPGQPF